MRISGKRASVKVAGIGAHEFACVLWVFPQAWPPSINDIGNLPKVASSKPVRLCGRRDLQPASCGDHNDSTTPG